MNGYLVPVTCAGCGSDLEHVNASRSLGSEACAIARCSHCNHSWQVIVHLRSFGVPKAEIEARRIKRKEPVR